MRFLTEKTGLLASLVVAGALTIFGATLLSLLEMRRAQSDDARNTAQRNAVVASMFSFEARFVQFASLLAAAAQRPVDAVDWQPLALGYAGVASQVALLRTARELEPLRSLPDYAPLALRLGMLVQSGDALMASWPEQPARLRALQASMEGLGPQVQRYTASAVVAATRIPNAQLDTLARHATLFMFLSAAQLALVGLATLMLVSNGRQQSRARRRLQRLATEMDRVKREAETANHTKSQFLANMSHELRTPFQGVIGMLQLLEQEQPTDKQLDLIRTARDSAEHLSTLLNDVLDVSALETGNLALHQEPLSLRRLCHEVQKLMRGQALSRDLALVVRVEQAVPRRVLGDGTRIKQILLNLLSNAIKFTPSGEISLTVTATPASGAATDLRLSVTDTGIGMDEATLARLFRRFERGDEALSRRVGGAGLGLEISRTLARLMGGDITVRSQPGKGTRFDLCLRLALAPAAIRSDLDSKMESIAAPPGLRVLVADDHPVNRKYLALVLESMGHEPTLCEDGQQAVDAIRDGRSPFDLVLMDVHMPVLDGLSATRAIRALGGRNASLPILALTADVVGMTRERAQASGVTALLSKPIQNEQLADALAQAAAGLPVGHGEAMAPGPAVVASDFAALADHLPAGEFARLVDMFFGDESRTIAQLDAALASDDLRAIQAAAHKLSGCASVLGLTGIAALARDFSQAPAGARAKGNAHARIRLRQAIDAAREATARVRPDRARGKKPVQVPS